MHTCSKCEKPIEEARVQAIMELTGRLPEECLECAKKQPKPIGFMVMSGTKGARKVAPELIVIDPRNNPRFKEQLRQAQRESKRSR